MFAKPRDAARCGVLTILMLALAPATVGGAEGKDCYKTWDEARDAIKQNGLVSGKQINQLAENPANMPAESSFLEAYLCREQGIFVYQLYYIDKDGKVLVRTVDAHEPFPAN